jgi:AraC-like DNA-binding protein
MQIQLEERAPAFQSYCDETALEHIQLVERVIQSMHRQLHEPLSLEDMADIAHLSPSYFNRVFHRRVGVPPGEFLAALRLEGAKRLLLTTSLSVTDICFDLGYSSLGSFTTRFTQLIGVSPRQLRQLAERYEPEPPAPLSAYTGLSFDGVTGRVEAPANFAGRIYIGLFRKPIPQGLPVRCTGLSSPGPFQIVNVPDGIYYLLSAGLPVHFNDAKSLAAGALVATGAGPVIVKAGRALRPQNLTLRRPQLTDPPVLLGLPYI